MMLHVAPADHPEQPQRIERIWSAFMEDGIVRSCRRIPSRLATDEELLRCHPQEHIDRIADCFHKVDPGEMELKKVKLQQNKYQYRLDEDTYDGLHSNLAARLAAGSIMAVTEAVLSDKENVTSGFAVVRPPGHHCESKTPQGFCLFNSVAVAARHAQAFAPKRCKKAPGATQHEPQRGLSMTPNALQTHAETLRKARRASTGSKKHPEASPKEDF